MRFYRILYTVQRFRLKLKIFFFLSNQKIARRLSALNLEMSEPTVGDNKDKASCDGEDDAYFCDVCNIKFDMPKAYFSHVYSVSHLQRANVAEKQGPIVRSSTALPVAENTTSTEAESKMGEGPKMGTETEKPPISEHQSQTMGGIQLGIQEATSGTIAVAPPNPFGGMPVGVGGTPSSTRPGNNTSLTGGLPAQVVTGGMTVAPQVVSSVAVVSSDTGATSTSTLGSYESTRASTITPDAVTVSSSSTTGQPQPLNPSISVPHRPPSNVAMPPKTSPTKPGPLLSTPRVPSLMSGVPFPPRPQLSGFDPRPAIAPGAGALRPQLCAALSPNQKIPLLRDPQPALSPFSGYSDTYSAPYMGTAFAPRPSPVLPHYPNPLLPTPTPVVRGTLPAAPVQHLMNLPTSATPAGRADFSRSWDQSSFSGGGDDPQPPGVTVKEYHHGRPAEHKVAHPYETEDRSVPREKPGMMGSHVEPLMNGSWVLAQRPFDNKGRTYRCEICGVKFDDFLFHELHLAGVRHRKMAKSLTSKASTSESGAFHTPYEKMDVTSHDPVFVTGLLDKTPTSSSAKVPSSASFFCYSELEQKLRNHPEPILGVDYLTEYRFLGGRLEYSCDLCDVELKSVTEVADHVTSTRHRLQYLCYNDVETYKSVKEATDVGNSAREAAEKIEKRSGRKSRFRVKLESDDLSSDGQFAWIEVKDESIRPISAPLPGFAALPGHRLCTDYSKAKPHEPTIVIDSVDALLQTLALHSCLAANRPPSLARPLRRMDFITALGEFSMTSDKDAEICFQLANFLTVAVINFRRQMLPTLNAIDVSSIEKRLTTLLRNAEAVSQKIITSDPAELDITRLES